LLWGNFAGGPFVSGTIYNEQRVIQAAKRYAAWDKSDPFVLARALCHIANGIARPSVYFHEPTAFHKAGEVADCIYDAEEHSVARGGVVTSTFTNMVRP
jgi:hypothetical protein